MQLAWIAAPVIGGLIGLITNSLAIKMLFSPHQAVYIGRFHVPFTPGLIPKEKERIAATIGEVISKYLLDADTIQKAVCDLQVKERAAACLHDFILRMKQVSISLEVYLDQKGVMNPLNIVEARLSNSAGEYLTKACVESGVVDELVEKAFTAVHQEMNPVLAKLAKAPMESAKPRITADIKEMLCTRGPGMIGGYIDQQYVEFCDRKVCDLAKLAEEREEEIVDFLWEKYVSFIQNNSAKLLLNLNLQQIVEERINSYDVAELEKMILSISKKELNALVWLGGMLGMLMGFINLAF